MNSVVQYAYKKINVAYPTLRQTVQENYTKNMWELTVENNISQSEKKEKIMAFLTKEVKDRSIAYLDISSEELIQRLYDDIIGYSVLSKYLDDDKVEGINVNAWDDIRVAYQDGAQIKVEPFSSPEFAMDITKKLLRNSNITIDEAVPMAEASIGSNIRITAIMYPIVSKETGVAMYIRKLRDKVFTVDEYVEKSFASPDVLNTIHVLTQRGISTLYIGKVNTGKTTLVKHALDCLPDNTQIITIETGSREMNLVKRDNEGRVINNVVHMLTRLHENESQNITQEKLVVKALRLNPDVLSVAEMRDIEAYAAIEASNSGHTVVSTVHSGSFQQAHRRVANLSRKRYQSDFSSALMDAVTAYPVGVFIHTTEDGVRRIMNISESYIDDDGNIKYKILWEYRIKENIKNPDGSIEIIGDYVQVNNPSIHLQQHMTQYGITERELRSLMKKGAKM